MSADLSGSTAFKNSGVGQVVGSEGVPSWVSTFSAFYRNFPAVFTTIFDRRKSADTTDCKCPSLWKAVGDELVFCSRVRSKDEVKLCVDSFIDALHHYRSQTLQSSEPDGSSMLGDGESESQLDLKGAGWLATFPHPNLAIKIIDDGDLLKFSEETELAADEDPFSFDFVGKAIDTGFRIAKNAKRSRFVLSVQLAQTLLATEEGRIVYVDTPQELRGVNRGAPYPSLYLDTMDHFHFSEVRKMEREMFGKVFTPKHISDYLRAYCEAVGTEEICLPDKITYGCPPPPKSYTEFVDAQRCHLQSQADLDGDTEPEPLEGSSDEEVAEANLSSITSVR